MMKGLYHETMKCDHHQIIMSFVSIHARTKCDHHEVIIMSMVLLMFDHCTDHNIKVCPSLYIHARTKCDHHLVIMSMVSVNCDHCRSLLQNRQTLYVIRIFLLVSITMCSLINYRRGISTIDWYIIFLGYPP